jgi:CRP-like cAMP-binding protein
VIQEDLKRAPLFASLPPDELAELAVLARPLRLPPHQVVFSQGDVADSFYLVARGRVRIFKMLRDGRAATMRHVGEGETFGEAALFAPQYPAFAQTMDEARLYRIRIEPFRRLLAERPGLALNLLAAQAHLMVLLSQRVEELLLPVPARLARYLLELATQQGTTSPRLPVAKRELASRLGTVPETLSRTLTQLARSRLIRRKGETIEILDPEGLDRLARL